MRGLSPQYFQNYKASVRKCLQPPPPNISRVTEPPPPPPNLKFAPWFLFKEDKYNCLACILIHISLETMKTEARVQNSNWPIPNIGRCNIVNRPCNKDFCVMRDCTCTTESIYEVEFVIIKIFKIVSSA